MSIKLSNGIEVVTTDTDLDLTVYRMKVPGGWLVITLHTQLNLLSTDVVADPEHKWTPTVSNDA